MNYLKPSSEIKNFGTRVPKASIIHLLDIDKTSTQIFLYFCWLLYNSMHLVAAQENTFH